MEQQRRDHLYYIENWSLLFDIRIILAHLFVGFSHPNALPIRHRRRPGRACGPRASS